MNIPSEELVDATGSYMGRCGVRQNGPLFTVLWAERCLHRDGGHSVHTAG